MKRYVQLGFGAGKITGYLNCECRTPHATSGGAERVQFQQAPHKVSSGGRRCRDANALRRLGPLADVESELRSPCSCDVLLPTSTVDSRKSFVTLKYLYAFDAHPARHPLCEVRTRTKEYYFLSNDDCCHLSPFCRDAYARKTNGRWYGPSHLSCTVLPFARPSWRQRGKKPSESECAAMQKE